MEVCGDGSGGTRGATAREFLEWACRSVALREIVDALRGPEDAAPMSVGSKSSARSREKGPLQELRGVTRRPAAAARARVVEPGVRVARPQAHPAAASEGLIGSAPLRARRGRSGAVWHHARMSPAWRDLLDSAISVSAGSGAGVDLQAELARAGTVELVIPRPYAHAELLETAREKLSAARARSLAKLSAVRAFAHALGSAAAATAAGASSGDAVDALEDTGTAAGAAIVASEPRRRRIREGGRAATDDAAADAAQARGVRPAAAALLGNSVLQQNVALGGGRGEVSAPAIDRGGATVPAAAASMRPGSPPGPGLLEGVARARCAQSASALHRRRRVGPPVDDALPRVRGHPLQQPQTCAATRDTSARQGAVGALSGSAPQLQVNLGGGGDWGGGGGRGGDDGGAACPDDVPPQYRAVAIASAGRGGGRRDDVVVRFMWDADAAAARPRTAGRATLVLGRPEAPRVAEAGHERSWAAEAACETASRRRLRQRVLLVRACRYAFPHARPMRLVHIRMRTSCRLASSAGYPASRRLFS